eukprot:TRINITY_DN55444_c0_g1_i1.p1 TRINITY_DN55444_c0_g1~~TRINITY_DN55444_c0_g1_i1.p1  ORF type:complete len:622 (-),score=76.67 TRINITY_DN55444_c0_g1_i1:189-2054(-)
MEFCVSASQPTSLLENLHSRGKKVPTVPAAPSSSEPPKVRSVVGASSDHTSPCAAAAGSVVAGSSSATALALSRQALKQDVVAAPGKSVPLAAARNNLPSFGDGSRSRSPRLGRPFAEVAAALSRTTRRLEANAMGSCGGTLGGENCNDGKIANDSCRRVLTRNHSDKTPETFAKRAKLARPPAPRKITSHEQQESHFSQKQQLNRLQGDLAFKERQVQLCWVEEKAALTKKIRDQELKIKEQELLIAFRQRALDKSTCESVAKDAEIKRLKAQLEKVERMTCPSKRNGTLFEASSLPSRSVSPVEQHSVDVATSGSLSSPEGRHHVTPRSEPGSANGLCTANMTKQVPTHVEQRQNKRTTVVVNTGVGTGSVRVDVGTDEVANASARDCPSDNTAKRRAGVGKEVGVAGGSIRAGCSGGDGCNANPVKETVVKKPPRPAVPSFQAPLDPWIELRRQGLPPWRQEDNYEISEPGDLSEDEVAMSREADRSKKHVPAWCGNFLETLKNQASIDPDTIFGNRVPVCNLEIVFPDPLYDRFGQDAPKRRRGSSGDWGHDKLTHTEVRDYKQKMGQTNSWRKKPGDSSCPMATSTTPGAPSAGIPVDGAVVASLTSPSRRTSVAL